MAEDFIFANHSMVQFLYLGQWISNKSISDRVVHGWPYDPGIPELSEFYYFISVKVRHYMLMRSEAVKKITARL